MVLAKVPASARYKDLMLIMPSAVPLSIMDEEMISAISINCLAEFKGPMRPSTECSTMRFISVVMWGAVIHFHSLYVTALAMMLQPIPASHYSIAAFGGVSVEVADYACYGTAVLAQNVVNAMKKRVACLMSNHGALVVG